LFSGLSGIQTLLRRLFRLPSSVWSWYIAAIVLPSSCVLVATVLARALHQGAPLIAMEALLSTIVIQLGSGALGEGARDSRRGKWNVRVQRPRSSCRRRTVRLVYFVYFALTCSFQLLARPWPLRNGRAVSTNCGARPIS